MFNFVGMKTIIRKILFCFAILFSVGIYCADMTMTIGKAEAGLQVNILPDKLDMGTTRPEIKKTMSLLLKNNSGEDITIENWRSPCVCFEFKGAVDELSAGAEIKVSVTLDGKSYRGEFSKYMFMAFRSKKGNLKEDFFLPIKFAVKDDAPLPLTSPAVEPDNGVMKFIEYTGGGIEKHKKATAWIFAGKDCPNCNYLKSNILPKLLESKGIVQAEIILVDLDKKENFLFLAELEESLKVKDDKTPVLLWQNKLYYGNDKIKELIAGK